MKSISTGVYTFEKLISEGCLYVDKTRYLYDIVREPSGYFFMSRPRRFGKSLTVSTLDAIFRGKRELFEGLYIYDRDYDWREYPVIHIDFGQVVMKEIDELNDNLVRVLESVADDYGLVLDSDDAASGFGELIKLLSRKYSTGVVLLIDEYDKPLLDHLRTPEEAEVYRDYMDSFYQVIKGADPFLRFVFITGVTRFAKVSIFSKLNNIYDISMDEKYAEMLGYTDAELGEYFGEYIDAATAKLGVMREKLLEDIRTWYDGFNFCDGVGTVYNPVSIGMFMKGGYRFKNYWFSTGTPTFLMNILKKNRIVLSDLKEVMMTGNSIDTFDVARLASDSVDKPTIVQMLYQTGYLTLDRVMIDTPVTYRLRFPNYEVEQSFSENLLSEYAGSAGTDGIVMGIVTAGSIGDTDEMMDYMKNFFAGLPYDIQIKSEKYYQSVVYTIFRMCGMRVMTELRTNTGRIDAVMTVADHVYIIEFKLNKSADEAVTQIDEKKYAEQFILPARKAGKTVHKLGINFCYDDSVRNVVEWKEEV